MFKPWHTTSKCKERWIETYLYIYILYIYIYIQALPPEHPREDIFVGIHDLKPPRRISWISTCKQILDLCCTNIIKHHLLDTFWMQIFTLKRISEFSAPWGKVRRLKNLEGWSILANFCAWQLAGDCLGGALWGWRSLKINDTLMTNLGKLVHTKGLSDFFNKVLYIAVTRFCPHQLHGFEGYYPSINGVSFFDFHGHWHGFLFEVVSQGRSIKIPCGSIKSRQLATL